MLLTIGRLDRQKDLPTLLEAAAASAPKTFCTLTFLLVGEGPDRRQIEDMIRDRGLVGRVHLTGWRADIPELLAAGDALILSSRWEGMPNVVLEAMAAGLPVVATQVEGIAELVIHGRTGLVVPRQSPRDLAAAIEKILTDPTAAKVLGAAGRERAKAEFSWEKMLQKYEQIYESI